jgi:uncharacterized protein YodC (DUF2158 family)
MATRRRSLRWLPPAWQIAVAPGTALSERAPTDRRTARIAAELLLRYQARTVADGAIAADFRSITMNQPFKIGDVVVRREGSLRMKVAGVDKADGRVRCTWVRGPAKYTQSFDSAELIINRIPAASRP